MDQQQQIDALKSALRSLVNECNGLSVAEAVRPQWGNSNASSLRYRIQQAEAALAATDNKENHDKL